MCIICNCDKTGDKFLVEFSMAQIHMKKAAERMLVCSREAKTPEQRRQYDHTYKHMVRIIRDWNGIEHEREPISTTNT